MRYSGFLLLFALLIHLEGRGQSQPYIAGPDFVCQNGEADYTLTNAPASSSFNPYQWTFGGRLIQPHQNDKKTVTIDNFFAQDNPAVLRCEIFGTDLGFVVVVEKLIYHDIGSSVIAGDLSDKRCQGPGTTQFILEQPNGASLEWSVTGTGNTISNTGIVTWAPDFVGVATVSVQAASCGWATSTKTFTVEQAPPQALISSVTACAWEPVELTATNVPEGGTLNWYSADNILLAGNTRTYRLQPSVNTGSYQYRLESITKDGCRSVSKSDFSVVVVDDCDDQLNYIETLSYDGEGEQLPNITANSRIYYDKAGMAMQTQTRAMQSGRVFAAEKVKDKLNRDVIQTLSAPIAKTDFNYRADFVLNPLKRKYSYIDFDAVDTKYNPATVNDDTPGTLGWYYSSLNTLEQNVPVANFPYSRKDMYEDGTGEIRRSASGGNILRMGSGKEVVSGTFPVYHELDNYLSKRADVLPGIVQPTNLVHQGVQTVVRDENGSYIITVTDKDGKVVMVARKGGSTNGEYVMMVENSITSSGNPSSADFRPLTYFYLLEDQAVSLSGSNFIVEDILHDVRKPTGETFAGPNGKWPAGFYRVVLSTESASLSLSYKNFFTDIAYQFYNDAGRLVSSVSPKGMVAWLNGSPYNSIDKTVMQYNFRGLLKSTSEVDAGTSKFIYRKDGRIRFSQNAVQRDNALSNQTTTNTAGKFSFTLYDDIGRPVESGEYIGTSQVFELQYDYVEYNSQQPYVDSEKKDWISTTYDIADNEFALTSLAEMYTQTFIRGAVSTTENKHIKTWYSYDELGRVVWIIQKPKALQRFFVVEYTYNFSGNVLTVTNLAYDLDGNRLQQFNHHYEYDADRRLSKVYTSANESAPRRLRASYFYYLHGPLKRIELGDNVQGIDFVYNIHGWLTHINHPDKAQDPGGDGNDIFGMLLDYYESDMVNLYTATYNTHSSTKIHGLAHIMQPGAISYRPLIRIHLPAEYSEDALSGYSKYSAENPMYREQIGKLKNSLSDN